MNEEKTVKNRFTTRREAALRQIAGIGPFVEGTLVRVPHKTCSHVAHRLTFKVAGKTRAVYVPLDRVKDVEAWTKEYRRLKRLIRTVTNASLGELRNHVMSRRATAGGRKSPVRTRPA